MHCFCLGHSKKEKAGKILCYIEVLHMLDADFLMSHFRDRDILYMAVD